MATEQIDSFDDLLGLLEREPEYRSRLRELILDEEFQQLPAQVRLLVETVRLHSATLKDMVRELQDHGRQLRVLERNTSRLIGNEAEQRFQQNAPAYFGTMLRRIRVIDKFALADMIDDAIDAGSMTEGDRRSLLALDVVVRGLDRETRQPMRLAVEVSAGIGERDIMRAKDRAQLLEKLTGESARPVVGGYFIAPEFRELAEDKGVKVSIVAPPDVGEPELPTDIKAEPPP